MDEERWAKAKNLIRRELKKRPHDFFWLAELAFIYREEGDSSSALETIRKALELAPGEPLVLYYYAVILRSFGRPAAAVEVLRRIIRKGERRIGTVETKEGIRWGRSLVNDCRYEIALCCEALKDFPCANWWLKLYAKGKQAGVSSWYGAAEVAAFRRRLEAAH